MTLAKYHLSTILLVTSVAVIHVTKYVLPDQALYRHLFLFVYLLYVAWQYKKINTRRSLRDRRIPESVYGAIDAEKAIIDGSYKTRLENLSFSSPDYADGFRRRLDEYSKRSQCVSDMD